MLNLTYEYRAYPTANQSSTMEEWLATCKRVYNYALAERRDWIQSRKCPVNACSIQREFIYPMDSEKPTYYSQKRNLTAARKTNSFLQAVHSQVLQDVMGRLEKAFNALWNSGFGFPRFKKRFRSFNFPQLGKNPIGDNQIKLPVFGWVKTVMHRPIPDGFEAKQARVVKRASGWYIQLVIQSDVKIPEPPIKGHAIGIDVGLSHFVATSDNELIARPQFFVEAQHRLKVLNRAVARKQKGSKNQQKACQRVARFYERIANRRKDFHRKLAHHLCDQAGMIFAEELNLKGLAKGMLGKHCLDAGWGQFLDTLKWVCFKRGVYFQKVKAAGTSQECPECGVAVKKDLSMRRHECPECGYTTNRDVASGQVIRNRGLASTEHVAELVEACRSVAVGQTVQSCGATPSGEALKQEFLEAT
ncbi:transposase [Picosynechococcus sp. PCC 11901]|uniref:RNA-guided endonuclease InsQ/TnpB family protein n=3 Tax=Cyanophyceae TaxID=3028117 RepID=UPI0010FC13FB|nr:RNA-guided endonuclease TnpB family protein [Picosynechococcus sp. PCC 11901]QCS49372.1 transposase [Picosynechococcus sp. PCC 11901]